MVRVQVVHQSMHPAEWPDRGAGCHSRESPTAAAVHSQDGCGSVSAAGKAIRRILGCLPAERSTVNIQVSTPSNYPLEAARRYEVIRKPFGIHA